MAAADQVAAGDPQYIVLFFLDIASFFVVIAAWFAILITGRYPRGMFGSQNGMWERYGASASTTCQPADVTASIKRIHIVQGLISEYRRAA